MVTTAQAPTRRWARQYETIYIMRPAVSADAASEVADRARDVIAKYKGVLTKVDNWGRRKLAYEIKKHNRGLFVYLQYVGTGELVAELERNLRLRDEIIRFQTIMTQDDIDLSSVSADPDNVKFLPIEEEEEEEVMDRATKLGLVPREQRPRFTESDPGAAEAAGASEPDTEESDEADVSSDGDTEGTDEEEEALS